MADQRLNIRLLGYPQVRLGTELIDSFVTKRAEALFYYLMVERRVHSRDKLATLFWPDMGEVQSKKNLRTALPVLRKLFDDYLLVTRDTVGFQAGLPYFLDTEALATAVSSYREDDDPTVLETAVADYQGEFLEGFYVDGSPEFDDWVLSQSEHWRGLYVQGLHLLTTHYRQHHQYIQGLITSERLLAIEPWNESAYRQRMLLYAYYQQRSSALKTYEQCQQILQKTFNIPPMVETTALYKRIKAEEVSGTEQANPYHNLPRQLTPFIGRQDELRQLRQKALDDQYPLITIMGEGGIGKSRLAQIAASQLLYDFADGVWFIPFIGVPATTDAEQANQALALAIAQALQLSLAPNASIPAQVLGHLRAKQLLLVLDNLEQLIDGADFLLQIVRQAKKVKLLVTTRRRLNLQTEFVIRLQGLPVPRLAEETADVIAEANGYTSVELFMERAKRVNGAFVLTADNVTAVTQICRLVDGLPLGIELAAALVERQNCAAIVAYIEQDAVTLSTDMRDLATHHRSVGALFEYSWQLLSDTERLVLAQCSLFAGGFTLEAATAVAHATEAILTNLLYQSLLTRDENGRYQFHPLIHQFSQQKLTEYDPDVVTAVATRHYTYYLGRLQANRDTLISWTHKKLREESNNIRQAWQTATEMNDFAFLATIMEGMIIYIFEFAVKDDWLNMVIRTADKFQQIATITAYPAETHAAFMMGHLYALLGLGQFNEMSLMADQFLAFAPTPLFMAYAHKLKGIALRCLYGDSDEAVAHLSSALQASHHFPIRLRIANQVELSIMLLRQGQDDAALEQLEQAYAVAKEAKFPRLIYILLVNLGVFYEEQNDYSSSIPFYEMAYETFLAQTHEINPIILLDRWATSLTELGQYDKAEEMMGRSRKIWQNWLPATAQGISYLTHARLYVYMQQYEKGRELAQQALDLFREQDQEAWGTLSLVILGRAQLELQQWSLATEALQQAFATYESKGDYEATSDPLAGLVMIALRQMNEADLRKWGTMLSELLPCVSISHEAVDDWDWVYLTCYQALTAVNDPRAPQILQTAYDFLQKHANLIKDNALRQSYLQNVPTNREIMRLASSLA